jgi:hypothetical protein
MIARRQRGLTLLLVLFSSCQCPDFFSGGKGGEVSSGSASPAGGGPLTSDPATADGNDRVSAVGNGPAPSVVVALNGKGRTTCYFGKIFQGSGPIDLNDRIESPATCASGVAAFARDRAAQLDPTPAWSHDPARPLQLTMQSTVDVPIHFYVPQGSGLDQDAKDEMDIATGLYAANRAGIRFSPAGITEYAGTPVATACDDAATLVTKPDMYDPETINVYYVTQVNYADMYLGYNCFEQALSVGGATTTGENIILLAAHRTSTTLAHELGHALGLRLLVGHTSTAGGFTTKNLMMGGISWADEDAQDHFSVGQVYRMSFDQSSWINHGRATQVATIRVGPTRSCQKTPLGAIGDECPKLVLDP